jgi:hypothetical protein
MHGRSHTLAALRSATGFIVESLERRRLMAGVVINEFLADNVNGIVDQDNFHSDWIEIRNTDATSVNLAGWTLTDDAANLTKWQFPSTTLASGAYLLVYASGKNRAVAGQQLHTNFQLDAAGEYLALVKPGGIIADSFAPYPEQLEDISYGRGSTSSVVDTLVGEAASVKAKVPTAASAIDSTWRNLNFVPDGTWTSGSSGIGYDTSTSPVNYGPYIGLSVQSAMSGTNRTSAYIRIPFNVADPTALASLHLKMRWDDGFIAYLNGTEIGSNGNMRRAFPPGSAPAWNSIASANRDDAQAIQYEDLDISSNLNLLLPGANVLAIHGLNVLNSSDLLQSPLLTADRSLTSASSYMSTPTPGAGNALGTLGFVKDTKFTVDRGFFETAFNLGITSDTAGAQIRYTTDGSVPTATSGSIYSAPFAVDKTTTVRAAAFKTGWTSTDVDTQTYIFLNSVITQNAGLFPTDAWGGSGGPDWTVDSRIATTAPWDATFKNDMMAVPSMSLVMPWNDWFGTGGQGIYIDGTNTERAGSVEMISATSATQEFQINAALEIQGASSAQRWNNDKLSIKVTFKAPYGPTKLNTPLFTDPVLDKGAPTEFDSFVLDSMYDDSWMDPGSTNRANAKLIQDQFAADLQNLAGGYGPHGRFVQLYLNGLYWGMYYLHEIPDDSFASAMMGGDRADYDVLKHNGTTVVAGDSGPSNYSKLFTDVRKDMTVAANYNVVAGELDIDNFIDYMIVNQFVGNTDWSSHNWYASYDRVNTKKWRFSSWDAEISLRSVNTDNTVFNEDDSPTELQTRLSANPEYRLRFADQVQRLLFNGGVLAQAGTYYQRRVTEIDRAIVGESARWGDNHGGSPLTREQWRATQDAMQTNYFAFSKRPTVLLGQYTARGWLQSLTAPNYSQFGGQVNPGYQLTITKPAGSPASAVIYYTLDGSDPRVSGGAISSTAVQYASAITLNTSKRVKARIYNAGSWSAIIDATFFTPNLFPVRISELSYHPGNPNVVDPEDLEFIELVNTGSSSVNLQGVQITTAIDPYTFGNINLAAGQRIVVARTPAIFDSIYGPGVNRAPTGYTGKLDNAGESITLLGPLGETLQSFTYDDAAPWPTTPDGGGPTLEIINPLGDPNDPTNWRASFADGGTPGAASSPPAVVSSTFEYDAAQAIRVVFDRNMDQATFSGADVTVQLQPGGQIVNPTSVSFPNATTALFTFATPLADGNYRATLLAGSVKDTAGVALGAAGDVDFFVLGADANGDRHVDAADQAILTAHLGQSNTFKNGDFDYNGTVNAADQAILNQKLKLWLPPVGALSLPATGNSDVYRLRRESASLLQVYAAADATPTYRVMLGAVSSISFAGGVGDDWLILDCSNGLPLTTIPVNFDGGNVGSDTFKVVGTPAADVVTWSATSLVIGAMTTTYGGVENRIFEGDGGFDDLTLDAVRASFLTSQQFQNLHLTDTARATLPANGNLFIRTRGLQLDGSAQLDLADNDLILDYTGSSPLGSASGGTYSGVTGMIQSGNNSGLWNGPGIVTSMPDAVTSKTVLGVADASETLGLSSGATALWHNVTIDDTTLLIKYTYAGDQNLDGVINADDYAWIDLYSQIPSSNTYNRGDLNYNGAINADDYALIDLMVTEQGNPL